MKKIFAKAILIIMALSLISILTYFNYVATLILIGILVFIYTLTWCLSVILKE
jgi:predicted membrane protein